MQPRRDPPNPYLRQEVEWLGPQPEQPLEVYEEDARSILQTNDSPDIDFDYSVNPYRGCSHACAFCYARTGHEFLGFNAGQDFERRIVVKRNAPELLERELRKTSWRHELIAFSGVTDCYQPLEAGYRITRRCLELCLRHRNPVGIVTRSPLIRRDIDLLLELHRVASVRVQISIGTEDDALARALEPGAPPPSARFTALAALAEAGIPCGIFVAPVIPGLNDAEIPRLLERAKDAGARHANTLMLRLPGSVREVFLSRLAEALPQRAARIESRIREMRGGELDVSAFHERNRGRGPYAEATRRLFELTRQRLGLLSPPPLPKPRPRPIENQGELW